MKNRIVKACREAYSAIPRQLFGGRAMPPLQIALTVTYHCNLKCSMCLQRVEEQKARTMGLQELSGEEIRDIILQTIPRLANIGFCGGEIFMRKDIMDLLHFAAARNRVSLVSNGTLITPGIAAELVAMNIRFMLFSVDGPPHMHDKIRGRKGTFLKVMSSLESVIRAQTDQKNAHLKVHANCVVMRDNAGLLRELIGDLASVGIRHLGLQIEDRCLHRWSTSVQGMGQLFEAAEKFKVDGMESIQEILEDAIRYGSEQGVEVYLKPDCTPREFSDYYNGGINLEDYECTLPWSQIFISPHGEVYPCFMMKVGSVREQKMGAAWNSAEYQKFRRALHKKRLFPQCYGCCFMRKKHSTSGR